MPNQQPVDIGGVKYTSKQAASWFLREQGLDWDVVATKVGTTIFGAKAGHQAEKKKLAKTTGSPEATPGIWTPEKRDKVRRLFGLTMIEIANAVHVPAAELLTYVLHGAIPPSETIKDPGDIRWTGDQAQLPAPAAGADEAQILPREAFEAPDTDPDVVDADHLVEPDRDDDEAVLAALEAAENRAVTEALQTIAGEVVPPAIARFQPAPAAPAPRPVANAGVAAPGELVCLMDETGRYLHESLDGMTTNPRFAWKGGRDKLTIIQKRLPHLRELDTVAFTR